MTARASALAGLAATALCGCGGINPEKTLTSGTYTLDRSIPGAGQQQPALTLQLDLTAKTATITGGSAPVTLTLTARTRDRWVKDCFTNYSHTVNETFDVAPDPAVIGPSSFSTPVLTTKCGGRLLLGTLTGAGLVDDSTLVFNGP